MATDTAQVEQWLMERLVTCFVIFGITGLLGLAVFVRQHRKSVAAFLWRCPQCGRPGAFLRPCAWCGRTVPGWWGGLRAALYLLAVLLLWLVVVACWSLGFVAHDVEHLGERRHRALPDTPVSAGREGQNSVDTGDLP